MKLIATKPFRNNTEPRLVIPGAQHPNHVHKGAVFTIGVDKSGKSIEDFDKLEKADRRTIQLLKVAGCIGNADDAEIVARINAEVADEKQTADNTKKIQAAGTADLSLLAQLLSGGRPAQARG